jgi:hypothetical protein
MTVFMICCSQAVIFQSIGSYIFIVLTPGFSQGPYQCCPYPYIPTTALLFYPEGEGSTFLRNTYQTTRRHITEGSILHSQRREILKSRKSIG